MSAFLLSNYHLSVLGRAAAAAKTIVEDPRTYRDLHKAKVFAQLLYEENVRSVRYRYEESDTTYPRGMAFDERVMDGDLDPVQILKACQSYHYQSCETDDYRQTEAWKIVDNIINAFIQALPGYKEAQWAMILD